MCTSSWLLVVEHVEAFERVEFKNRQQRLRLIRI